MDIWKRHTIRRINRHRHFLGGSTWMGPRDQILMAAVMMTVIVLIAVFGDSIQTGLKHLRGPGCYQANPGQPEQIVCEEGASPPSRVNPDNIIWRKF